ncbi:unnamed protein product [Brassica oleracea]
MRSGFGNVSFESPVQFFPLLYKLRFSCQLVLLENKPLFLDL